MRRMTFLATRARLLLEIDEGGMAGMECRANGRKERYQSNKQNLINKRESTCGILSRVNNKRYAANDNRLKYENKNDMTS